MGGWGAGKKACGMKKCCRLVAIFCNNTMKSRVVGHLVFMRIQVL